MKVKGIARLLLVGMLAAFTALCFAGCQDNSEEVIREGLTNDLNQVTDTSSEEFAKVTDSLSGEEFEQVGLNKQDVVEAIVDGFEYTINDITVDGNTAQANVTVGAKSAQSLMQSMQDATASIVTEVMDSGMTSPDEYMGLVGERIMDTIKTEPNVTRDYTIDLTKNGNTWSVDDYPNFFE